LALPLIHAAYVTAALGSVTHAVVLARRIAFEEHVLFGDPTYREAMGQKPRFFPFPLPLPAPLPEPERVSGRLDDGP
jgi:hypothetical protein